MGPVRDERRPPFCYITLEPLRVIRERLPATRQAGARDALLALAEAASLRRDGRHRSGDSLRELARLAGMSERRLRDHLRELEALGLLRVEARRDDAGRSLPTTYVLLDLPGGDKSSDRGDRSDDESSPPTRARVREEEEKKEVPPSPPQGGAGKPPKSSERGRSGRGSKRALGLNPRAVAKRERDAVTAERARAAAAALLKPSADQIDACRRVLDATSERASEAGRVWISHLRLVAVEGKVLVVGADTEEGLRYLRGRYAELLDNIGRDQGIAVRFATDDEHRGLSGRREPEAVAA